MLACDNAEANGSEKKTEENEALRTVECLRGRLLAERAASKAAKEDEELMDSKLKELEARLRSETKARKRLEKKLSVLTKKLQYLNIPYTLEVSDQSRFSSSDNSESSCFSFLASTEEPEREASQQTITTTRSSQQRENTRSPSLLQSSEQQNSSLNQNPVSPSNELLTYEQYPYHEILQPDERSASSETDCPRLSSWMEDNDGDTCKNQEENDVDNSMALVPLSFPAEQPEDSARKEVLKITSENVREVLETLKQIREKIQSTMQRRQSTRQMIQVG